MFDYNRDQHYKCNKYKNDEELFGKYNIPILYIYKYQHSESEESINYFEDILKINYQDFNDESSPMFIGIGVIMLPLKLKENEIMMFNNFISDTDPKTWEYENTRFRPRVDNKLCGQKSQ